MSYRETLKKRIQELEIEIARKEGSKEILERELKELMMKDFEEEMREDADRRTLLKG